MMLDGGVADGRRIVSEVWVWESTRPSGKQDGERGGYGLQGWIIGTGGAYAAIGLQGQFVYVDPATSTVVVKLSYFPPGDNRADGETRAFLAVASAWQPY